MAPERLVSKEGNNGRGDSVLQATRGSSGSTVMYNSSHPRKQPFVWTISNEEDVLIIEISSQV
jgi:hypothetical protein